MNAAPRLPPPALARWRRRRPGRHLADLQRRPRGAEVLAADRRSPRRTSADLDVAWQHAHRRRLRRRARPHAACTAARRREAPPPTVWSATPLFVNDTVYLGTPFYRIFALEPDTGEVKWTYDSHAVLEALTQPDLKNRGVAYWAGGGAGRRPALPEARLYRHDGREAACGRRRHRPALRRFRRRAASSTSTTGTPRTPSGRCRCCSRRPSSRTPSSSAGPARTGRRPVDSPGTVFALDARTGAVRWTFDTLPPEIARQDRHRQRLGLDVGRSRAAAPLHPGLLAQPQLLRRRLPARPAGRHLGDRARHRHRRDGLEPAARPPRHLGPTTPTPRRRWSTSRRTARPSRRWCRPRSRASSTCSTATPASRSTRSRSARSRPRRARRDRRRRPSPTSRCPSAWSPTAGPASSSSPTSSAAASAAGQLASLRDEGRFTPPSLEGSLVYPGTIGGVEWGGGAVDPRSGIFVVNYSSVGADLPADPARRLRGRGRAPAARPAASSR